MGDAIGARQFMEQTLLPNVQAMGLAGYILQLRNRYAVVLAATGDIDGARHQLALRLANSRNKARAR